MLSREQFRDLLAAQGPLVIDGALATELETRGHNLNHPMWSAKVIADDPGSIKQVHYDYYAAGADIAITASYQASTQGLEDHFGLSDIEGQKAIMRTVELAQDARQQAYQDGVVDQGRKLLVAGSVGPYGAYLTDGSEYRGDYIRDLEQFNDFHRPRLEALICAGVDLIALETMPNMVEIKALLGLLESDFPEAIAWLSCTTRDSDHLSDGTPWVELLDLVNRHDQVIAFGINCVAMASTTETLDSLHQHTELPLVCYPNSGETWDATTKTWHGVRPDDQLEHEVSNSAKESLTATVDAWIGSGASLIGGCCRTGPAYVRALRYELQRRRL